MGNTSNGGYWIVVRADNESWESLCQSCGASACTREPDRFRVAVEPCKGVSLLKDRAPVTRQLANVRRALPREPTLFFWSDEARAVVYYSPPGSPPRVYRSSKHPDEGKMKAAKAPERKKYGAPPPSRILGSRVVTGILVDEDDAEPEAPPVLALGQTTDFATPLHHHGLSPATMEPEFPEAVPRCDQLVTLGDSSCTVAEATDQKSRPDMTVAEFYSRFVKKDAVACAQEETYPQRSDEWKRSRKYCVTTSQFGAAAGLSPYSSPTEVVTSKLWETFRGNDATVWGTRNEPKAEQAYRGWAKRDLFSRYVGEFGAKAARASADSLVLEERGLIKYPATPWMGASPDGVAVWKDPLGRTCRRLVEYKCPYYLWRYTGSHPYDKHRKAPDNIPLPPQYRAQIQGVMGMFRDEDERISGVRDGLRSTRDEVWGITECDFVVWQPRRCWVSRVPFDPAYWETRLFPSLQTWFSGSYLPAAVRQYRGEVLDGSSQPRSRSLKLAM